MSQRANPTLIGAFVIGALALLITGLLVLGSGNLSGDRETLVLYFRYSTSGLKVGAPVVLKGVQIGFVKDIEVTYDDEAGMFLVPVYIEIDQDQIVWPGELREELKSQGLYETALKAGLRAKLGLQSLVTGMRQVEVGFFPGTDLVLYGKDRRYRELPTIPSEFERLRGQVENIPVEHLMEQALATLEGLNRLVNAPEMARILKNLDTTVAEFSQATGDLRKRFGTTGDRIDTTLDDVRDVARVLSTKLEGVLVALEQAAKEVRRLAKDADAEIVPLAKSLRGAGDSVQAMSDSAKGAFDTVSSAVGDGSPLRREALTAFRSLSAAAQSLRGVADYLERHPEALITGKR